MGYTTNFVGQFDINPHLDPHHAAYLRRFAATRRMKRDPARLPPAGSRRDASLWSPTGTWGEEGGYFVYGAGFAGQAHDKSVADFNRPPTGQPGLWCQWIPTADGSAIKWDGNEKFYDYVDWLTYLIEHFLRPAGYQVSGHVDWQGEEAGDIGRIIVRDNEVWVREAEADQRVLGPERRA